MENSSFKLKRIQPIGIAKKKNQTLETLFLTKIDTHPEMSRYIDPTAAIETGEKKKQRLNAMENSSFKLEKIKPIGIEKKKSQTLETLFLTKIDTHPQMNGSSDRTSAIETGKKKKSNA